MEHRVILDTGPLTAFLNRRDHYHYWVLGQLQKTTSAFITCEAVLSETLYLTGHSHAAILAISGMIREDLIRVNPVMSEQSEAVFQLMKKYNDLPASLADVCLLQMYNSGMGDKIMTLDADFRIFRDKKSKPLKLIIPA